MRQLPRPRRRDPNLLVGSDTADDAGVYRLDARRALVQTTDFFTPVVDDPFAFGQIAAANALSDVYAMGGRPLTALNLLGIPDEIVPPEVIAQILRGGAAKVREAGCALVGGHTIRNAEPIYGLSVTGLVHPKRLLTNAAARPGDLLVLTKPLGTGIVTTAIKRGLATAALAKRAIALMARLNRAGAELAERGLVTRGDGRDRLRAAGASGVDVPGERRVGVELHAGQVPVLGREVFSLIGSGMRSRRQQAKPGNRARDHGSRPADVRRRRLAAAGRRANQRRIAALRAAAAADGGFRGAEGAPDALRGGHRPGGARREAVDPRPRVNRRWNSDRQVGWLPSQCTGPRKLFAVSG